MLHSATVKPVPATVHGEGVRLQYYLISALRGVNPFPTLDPRTVIRILERPSGSLHGPFKPAHLAPRSPHDAYQLTWAAGGQGGRRYGTRTPDVGPKRVQKRCPFGPVTPGSRGPLRGSPRSVRGHLGLSELGIST